MQTSKFRLIAQIVAALLLLSQAQLASAQPKKPSAPPAGASLLLLPGSPLDLILAAPGARPPLQYETSVEHTRPELANKSLPVGPEYLQEGRALGNEGVVQAGRYILPFGTKGEKVGLAFLSGDYLPPEGEKLQPALAQLARKRAGQLTAQGTGVQPSVYALILLNGRLDDGLQTWLQERGVQLLGFYPYTAYQARIPIAQLSAVASHPQVRWVGQPYPVQKLDPELRMFMGNTTGECIWLFVNLFGHDESARETIAGMVEQTGTYDPSLGVLPIVTDAATVNRMLDMDAVLFVEPIRQSVALHTQSQASINADLLWSYQHDGRPQDGRPIKVGVMDSGFNIYHRDFTNIIGGSVGYNRTTETNVWDDRHGHGTHVLGTFIGEGVAQARYRGTAQGVQDTDVDGYDLLVSKVFRLGSDGYAVSEGSSVWEGLLDMQGRELRFRRQVFNYSGSSSGTTSPAPPHRHRYALAQGG